MIYDKDKALKIISNLKEANKDSDNFVLACDDLSYAISLAWIAYSTHNNGAKAMNERIKEAIESLPRDNPSRREAALDTLYSLTIGNQLGTGTKPLEQLFDYWLWSEGEPREEAHKAYVIALGEIEEFLCLQGLIYAQEDTDSRSSDTN